MSQFVELVRHMGVPFSTGVVIFLIIGLTSVLGALIAVVGTVVRHRQGIQFKRELLDRGMTIDEIERLIRSRKTEDE
jgi:hypothetical protein